MRIVIDMQGAQSTGSRHRGIGRYTIALCKEMIRLRGEHEVILALNGLFTDTIEPIRAAFANLLPEENIRIWEAVGPVYAVDSSNEVRRHAAEIVREAFIVSLQPDFVLVTSLFEGLVDDAIVSIGSFTTQLPSAIILYDLIPLIHRNIYLQNPVVDLWYMNKLDHLRRADLLLSISASSGQEAVDYLGFPTNKVVNISTACDSHFQPKTVNEAEHGYLLKTYGLARSFVMYTGGIDHRKNIEGLIRAYARLPSHIRQAHQLAVVCSIQESDRLRLKQLAKSEGLADEELVITGFVPEKDLLTLYNSCKLFVFPSWHEGFGLPALEAMACGRAVIGANTSSVPEVIGREDALFDPFADSAIVQKIEEVLTNDNFRAELECYGLKQAQRFSWEQTAHRAWQALEASFSTRKQSRVVSGLVTMPRRPRLAYISPLPPEQSGISDYSAELLPELARHYEIEVIVAQQEVSDGWIRANCAIRDIEWFRMNSYRFDRVLYHFGNSPFHGHMFGLLNEIPGVVVLHDFFLSHIVGHLDYLELKPNYWNQTLVDNHGWSALQTRYQAQKIAAVYEYPCNLEILQQALGVIVHSEYSRRLAEDWYGAGVAGNWAVIPLLRVPAVKTNRHLARQKLGLKEDDFVVCSFGLLTPSKLNHRLLSSWLASPLANDPHCRLVFVGQNNDGEYGAELVRTLSNSKADSSIEITGWVDIENYKTWLVAADIGVQLRTKSRGETSAAVLDCMNYSLATIVNANGSMADLPANAVWMLPDEFSDDELVVALTTLWQKTSRRHALGQRAKEVICNYNQPASCSEQYAKAIECFYQQASIGVPALVDKLACLESALPAEDFSRLATVVANNFPPQPKRKQLLLDISILAQHDAKSGIQRVVRSLLRELMLSPPVGWAVEPVFANGDTKGYHSARRFSSRFLGINDNWAEEVPISAWPGDIFIGLDLQHVVIPLQQDYLSRLHQRGIKVFFIVYDLLPLMMPQAFPDGTQAMHQRWLEAISNFDGAMCISRDVADKFYSWLQVFGPKRERPFGLSWFHLGADVKNSVPTMGMPADADQVLSALNARPSFLMVGTIEPRKGHAQTLAGFEQLWSEGIDANLVIVGKQGWKMESLVEMFRNHSEIGKRLFWLEGISDEYLEKVYAASTCLIAASEGEGFGLPLIEAAQHKLPIIARDIPVFREVAEDHAFYFADDTIPEVLSEAVRDWLALYRSGVHPHSDSLPWLTWRESAKQLLDRIIDSKHYKTWQFDGVQRFWGNDARLYTQVGERFGQYMRTTGQEGFLLYGPYTSLPAGRYHIVMNGNALYWTGFEWLDVACDKGELRILHTSLDSLNKGSWKYEAEFMLKIATTDLEFRLWVAEDSQLSVDSIQLVPVTEIYTSSTASVIDTGKMLRERKRLRQV